LGRFFQLHFWCFLEYSNGTMRREIRFVIPEARANGTLIDFLVLRFTYHTREEWLDRMASGRIMVNGGRVNPERVLMAGDEIVYEATDIPEPPMDDRISLVYQDDDLVLVNKSGNLTCHPGGRYFNHTLWALLKTRHGIDDPTFINRIDRETSGLVLVSRTPQATKRLRAQFAGRTVSKRYLALVEGSFPASCTACGWIAVDFGTDVLKKRKFVPVSRTDDGNPSDLSDQPPTGTVPPDPDAQWAVTAFRLICAHGPVSLIEASPHTGRLHQIRATLHELGYPLVGDKLYGADPSAFLRFCQDTLTSQDHQILRMKRQALHAAGLTFRHPRTGRVLEFQLPMPADMQAVLDSRSI